jgi:hypothetical protein
VVAAVGEGVAAGAGLSVALRSVGIGRELGIGGRIGRRVRFGRELGGVEEGVGRKGRGGMEGARKRAKRFWTSRGNGSIRTCAEGLVGRLFFLLFVIVQKRKAWRSMSII